MTKNKIMALVMVVGLAVVGFFWGPQVAKNIQEAISPIVSDVAPVDSEQQ